MARRTTPLALAAALLMLLPPPLPARGQRPVGRVAPADSGAFVLFKYQRPVGREEYTARRDGADLVVTTTAQLTFLGGEVPLRAELRLASDGTARRLEVRGATSTMTDVDLVVDLSPGSAHVVERGRRRPVRPIAGAFPSSHYPPLALEEALFAHWHAAGRPARVTLLPRGEVRFVSRGTDTVTANGAPVALSRFSAHGVIWGAQTVWFDARGRLVAAVGADAELDRFEGVRVGFEHLVGRFASIAVRDGLADLRDVARQIRPRVAGTFAITGVRVIDGTGSAAQENRTVLVRDGRIAAVGPRAHVAVPRGATIVDGRGRTVLPGLWDMHVHYAQPEWLAAGLAAGVTTARDVANEIELITGLRRAVRTGEALGPRLLAAGVVDGGEQALGIITAESPDEARAVVRRYHAAGFEQIKIYESLRPELVAVVATEAHRLGMTVTGHVPNGMSTLDFVRAGADQINHLNFVLAALRPAPLPGQPARPVELSSPEARAALSLLLERRTVIDPSLARREQRVHAKDSTLARYEPGVRLAPPALQEALEATGVAPDLAARLQPANERYLQLFADLRRAGVRAVLGTDLVVPGHSMHREMELAVQGGLTPLETIHLATLSAATAMGMQRESGSIAPGKRADLVIVDGDPAVRISDVRRVHAVATEGRLYDPTALWRAAGFEAPRW